MKKILITGGSGFLGSALVKKCLSEGWSVRILDDNSRGNLNRLKSVISNVEFISGDIRNKDVVIRASQGVDTIAHLAFINGTEFFYSKPDLVLDVGIKGALNTVEACLINGVKNYWLMSSSEVYQTPNAIPTPETECMKIPDPLNPRYSYGGAKLASELIAINCLRNKVDSLIIVRPHNVYGPDMGNEHVIPQFIRRANSLVNKSKDSVLDFDIKGDGSQTRAFVFINDFTNGSYLAFNSGDPEGIYHVGTEVEVSINEVAAEVMSCFGRTARIIPSETPKGETSRRCPSIEKIKKLGYIPKVSLKEGIQLTKDWYVSNQL